MFLDPVGSGRKGEELLWRKGYYEVVATAKRLHKVSSWYFDDAVRLVLVQTGLYRKAYNCQAKIYSHSTSVGIPCLSLYQQLVVHHMLLLFLNHHHYFHRRIPCLDNVLTSLPKVKYNTWVLVPLIYDHNAVVLEIKSSVSISFIYPWLDDYNFSFLSRHCRISRSYID